MAGEILEEANEIPNLEERRSRLLEQARLNPDSPLPHYLVGKTYEYEGKDEEAIRSYETALEIQPTCGPCHQALGKLLFRKKKRVEAQVHLRKAELFSPSAPE